MTTDDTGLDPWAHPSLAGRGEGTPTACERFGHASQTTYHDDGTYTWTCPDCGAEGWGDTDD